MAKQRKKIPGSIEAEVMYKSHLQCCVCQSKGDHIHHLNGDTSNYEFTNLILLCFPHHELASIKGNLGKKLSIPTLRLYRENHYKTIEAGRTAKIERINKPLTESSLTEEKILEISKNALIIIELEKIKERYFEADWKNKTGILEEIRKYSVHTNTRLALEVYDFLSFAASQTRAGMPEDLALGIFSAIMDFKPTFGKGKQKELYELGKLGIEIGDNLVYDSFIYLKKLSVARWGLTIIKFFYILAKKQNNLKLKKVVKEFYIEAHSNLNRPERNDLGNAKALLKVFENTLEDGDLSFPISSNELYRLIEAE
jgi:hypothetical protein